MSLTWLDSGKTGYYGKAMTIGILQSEAEKPGLLLIDSGLEGAFAKKMMKALSEDQLGLNRTDAACEVTLINTHSHADHIGGNHWLETAHHATCFSSVKEKPFIESPELEGHGLFSAEPINSLKSKFFCAEPTGLVHGVVIQDELTPFNWKGRQLSLIDLKGHSPGMIGVMEENGYLFLGDALFTPEIVDKHKLLFVHNVLDWLETLNRLEKLPAKGYILSHGGFYEDIRPLIEVTRQSLLSLQEQLYELLKTPKEEGQIHQALAEALGLVETVPGYFLNHAAIRAHLSGLMAKQLVSAEVEKGKLTFTSIG